MLDRLKVFFKKIWDTGFIKFAGSSFLCWSTDQILAAILGDWILPLAGVTDIALIANISGYTARIVSASMNFLINRKLVFANEAHFFRTALKYALLAVLIITLSNQGVTFLVGTVGLPRWISKIGCDFILYFVNFTGQKLFVFRKKTDKP